MSYKKKPLKVYHMQPVILKCASKQLIFISTLYFPQTKTVKPSSCDSTLYITMHLRHSAHNKKDTILHYTLNTKQLTYGKSDLCDVYLNQKNRQYAISS